MKHDLASLIKNMDSVSRDIDLWNFGLVFAAAMVFGLILKSLYNLYFQDNEPQDGSLARSLVILTPALTSVFWMIQSNLVLSLGLLGSMSFIRFRTLVKRAEDAAFIVVMMTVAIAIAINAIAIAGIIVGILLIYTLIKNRMTHHLPGEQFTVITFNTKKQLSGVDIQSALDKLNIHSDFVSSRTYDGITSYVFSAAKVNKAVHEAVKKCLVEFDQDAHINIFYPNERLGV